MIIKLFVLIILILINGVFAATEIAFLSLNKYELNKKIKEGNNKALKILNLINDSSTFLSSIQIAITLSGFLASAFAAESFAGEIASKISLSFMSVETLTTVLVVIITMVLSYFTLVFGELVPKKLGLAYSSKISYFMVDIINIVIKVFKPFIFILKSSVDFFVKLFKVEQKIQNDEAEIKSNIVDAKLEDFEKKLLFNVFEFNDTTAEEIMTLKKDIVSIDINATKEDVLNIINKEPFTRFPITKDGEIIGLINIKDFIIKNKKQFKLKDYIRKIRKIESDMIIDDIFFLLSSNHEVMAEVVKKGKTIGILTLEDIEEELIGNIFDEYN